MVKILAKLSVAALALTLAVATPNKAAPVMAASTKYISEVKVGMDKTEQGAVKELLDEGFTILSKDGKYADLNYEAGSNDALSRGQKKVYLGYKTTTNPSEAITDLAVMNMRGGYSIRDYEQLMETRLKSEILPFVDRFIATLQEYRDNLNSPYEKNKARAQYMKSMLNKLFDDDTLGLMGDLLVNETKYELGDTAYNALSEEEKKEHADIVTIVTQANGKIMLSMETLLTKATDTAENSWIDRLENNTLEDLRNELIGAGTDITEVDETLDRMYGDDANKLLEKWDAFSHALIDYDEKANDLANIQENEYDDEIAAVEKYDENAGIKENIMALTDGISARADLANTALDMELVAAHDRLEEVDYDFEDGSTLAEFFAQDASAFNGDGIRNLYPIVASLSAGQLAGLDFLSIQDLVTIATADETSYDLNELGDAAPGSIYEGVNREIFEKGKVALTNKALRAEAMKNDVVKDNPLSTTTYLLWGATTVASIAMVYSWAKFSEFYGPIRTTEKLKDTLVKTYEAAALEPDKLYAQVKAGKITCWEYNVEVQKLYDAQADAVRALDAKNMDDALANLDKMEESNVPLFQKSEIAMYLGVVFTVVMAILAAYSIYSTIKELIDYYKVEYSPIPKYIVEETAITETVDGVTTVKRNDSAYYQVAKCNRKPGDDFYDVLQNYADLNGDVGKEWLALYYVKQEGHAPIKADSLKVVTGPSVIPSGYTELGIHNFETTNAYNLTSKYYCYNDPNQGTYVYFQVDESVLAKASLAGSNFSTGSAVLFSGIGAVVGAGIAIAIMLIISKRKENKIVQE